MPDAKQILILGGAGFIGSHVAEAFANAGRRVTVIDGLMARTGADRRNIGRLAGCIDFIERRIEEVPDLAKIVSRSAVVIDSMGWTCHRLALDDPGYDAELNLGSHLTLLRSLGGGENPVVVYLGSRGQYGNPGVDCIAETCSLEPVDIQGIHKTAAESYYRVFAKRYGLRVASLRIPACIGPRQLIRGPDIGLFGGFARDLAQGRTVSVYGSGRSRALIDARDLTAMIVSLTAKALAAWPEGLVAYNIPGHRIPLDAAARLLRELARTGEVRMQPLPGEIARLDIGEADVDCHRLRSLIGESSLTPVQETFRAVLDYIREELGMIWRCDLVPQYEALQAEIVAAVQRVLKSGHYILAEELRQFEEEFSDYLAIDHVVGVANGTDALTLALQAAGAGPGDEVVTTSFSAIPTVAAIVDTGARPVFVDVCLDTFLLDIDLVPAAITERTKAVVPVHIFGNPVDIPRLKSLLPGRVAIVEDAAQAHGSSYGGRKCGTMGDLGAFSFYPTKNLGGYGDGGAVVTGNPDYARNILMRRNYGMVDKDHIEMHGVNSRLDEIQAAILRCKLPYLDRQNEARRAIAARYREQLRNDLFVHQAVSRDAIATHHVFASRMPAARDRMVEYLNRRGIQTNIYYPAPLYRQKPLAGEWRGLELPNVEQLCTQAIALPMYPELELDVQARVISAVNSF